MIKQNDLLGFYAVQQWAGDVYGLWEDCSTDVVEQLNTEEPQIDLVTFDLFDVLSAKLIAAEGSRSIAFNKLEAAIEGGEGIEEDGPCHIGRISMPCGLCPPGLVIINDDDRTPTPPTITRIHPDTVLMTKDTMGRVIWANHHLAHLLRQPLSFIRGKRSNQFFETKYGDTIVDHDLHVVASGSPLVCVESVPIRDTVRRRVAIRLPIGWGNKTVVAIAVIGFNPNVALADRLIKQAAS
jgi:hypothetical protein